MPRKSTLVLQADRTVAGIEAMIGQTIEDIKHETHGGLTITFENGLVVCVFADLTSDMIVEIEEQPQGEPIAGEARQPATEDDGYAAETDENNDGFEAEEGDGWADDEEG